MPRDAAVVRARLQDAALELFRDLGYDATTAADIAAHAGVTERTFFRQFADKREVFFDGEAELADVLSAALAAVPQSVGPMPAVVRALQAAVPLLERNRPVTLPRAAVIAATAALRERSLAKTETLVVLLADSLVARGVESHTAEICAGVGMAAFSTATRWWIDDPAGGLLSALADALTRLAAGVDQLA